MMHTHLQPSKIHHGDTKQGPTGVAGSRSPQKDPDSAPPVASGTAGSGLRPALARRGHGGLRDTSVDSVSPWWFPAFEGTHP